MIKASGIGKRFFPATQQILENVSFEVAAGETVAIVGPSGCGKSTLLQILCGLTNSDQGSVTGDQAVLMPQDDLLLPWYSAKRNVSLPFEFLGASKAQALQKAEGLLEQFGLSQAGDLLPKQLSGGMRQRVSFARAIASGRAALCLDEPFASLDAITRRQMQGWLKRHLAELSNRSVLLVTHDIDEALQLATRVLVLSRSPATVIGEVDSSAPAAHGNLLELIDLTIDETTR